MSDPAFDGAWGVPGGVVGLVALVAASVAGGAVNSVAGGGTILTFPVLAALLPPDPARLVIANATSTLGLWPGSLAAAWGYRGERAGRPAWAGWLLAPSIAGAVVGVVLLLRLHPELFAALVPWLILVAAVLFALQPRLVGRAARASGAPEAALETEVGTAAPGGGTIAAACAAQFLVSVYGGYFGAGIGILMLAILGLFGLGDIHRLNGVKNELATAINGVAAALFAAGAVTGSCRVSWPCVAVMAVGSVVGGVAGATVARRLPARIVRRGVSLIAFALAGYYLWRRFLA